MSRPVLLLVAHELPGSGQLSGSRSLGSRFWHAVCYMIPGAYKGLVKQYVGEGRGVEEAQAIPITLSFSAESWGPVVPR